MHEIKIKADPSYAPHELIVDITPLAQFGDHVMAKDVKIPAGVELMENPEEIVVNVSEPKEEPVEEAAPIDLSQIEVEKKGKEAPEDTEAEALEAAPKAEEKK
jgi:large subunit ribosomal protein L25